LELLLRLSRTSLRTIDQWRDLLMRAKYKVVSEAALTTDGAALFLCSP
jgi:hypothetical protein